METGNDANLLRQILKHQLDEDHTRRQLADIHEKGKAAA